MEQLVGVLLGCVIRGRLPCRVVSAAVSCLKIRSELVDTDTPAGGCTATTDLRPLEEPVLDEVALGPPDYGEAVFSESRELRASETVAELAGVVCDLGHHP
jgi:hypothetical protein